MIGRYSASGVSRWIALAAILVLSGAVHAQSQPVTSQNLDQYPIVKRERCGTHYLLPDGTIRAVITIKPHNYQLPDGSWAPIEEVLQAGGEFAWENMANGLTSQYSAASEDGVTFAGHNQPAVVLRPKRLAGYAKDGSTLKASSAAPAFAQREGEKTVVYSGLYKDIIDEYVLGPDRVKHNMVLYSNALEGFESSEFVAGEYTLEIPAGWRVEERNRKLRLLNEQGECIYELGSVDAFDAAGDVSNGQLTWQLEGTTLHLGMKVETAWLLDPERQWPVHIDPTLTLQPDGTAGKDALLYAGGGNRGTYSDLTFNSGGDCEGIIEFDLSSMPGGATVSAAQFEAWHRANTITGHVVNLYTASAAWVESTIVWTNKPARSATQFASLTFTNGSPNVWRIWTGMASTVSGWLSGGNNGFYIVNTTNSKFVAYLRASDWTTATERPRLVIDYTTGPNITTSVTSLNLGTTPQGTPGSVQNYTVSGFQTTAATTITAPSGVEIKLSTAGSYSGSINISNTGNWGPFTVDARLIGSTPGSVSGNITHASTGITTVNVACSGTVTGPTLTTSVASLNLGSTPLGTAGTAQSYTVTGSGMSNQTVITAPTDVEISETSATAGFGPSITVTTTGNWGPKTIWARIKSTAGIGSISGNITHVSTGANAPNVSVSGTVTGPTLSTSTGSLALGSTYLTYASTAVNYTVSGSVMSNQTVITAPANVEISETSATAGFGPTVTVTTTGSWGPKTIWARIKSNAPAGAISGNITHVSSGATTVNVSVSGTVNAPTITPSVASLNLGLTSAGTASTEVSYTVDGLGTSA
ncbi:MAG: DNRLRE domain-containing protein, partial [Planctomycetes bacterium]|nr:DNRLRE domain-containing protein [Planctomycetota bacterium]